MNVWRWPLLIAALSITGLLVGLLFDGPGDSFSWLALGLPVVLASWFGWCRNG